VSFSLPPLSSASSSSFRFGYASIGSKRQRLIFKLMGIHSPDGKFQGCVGVRTFNCQYYPRMTTYCMLLKQMKNTKLLNISYLQLPDLLALIKKKKINNPNNMEITVVTSLSIMKI
jgi:hypothetical protein